MEEDDDISTRTSHNCEEGSYLRLIDVCTAQIQSHESKRRRREVPEASKFRGRGYDCLKTGGVGPLTVKKSDKKTRCRFRKTWLPRKKEIQTPITQGWSTKIISMIKWIRTSRLPIKNFLSLCGFRRSWCRRGAAGGFQGPVDALPHGVLRKIPSSSIVG
jgi:hypothetical protein